MKRTLRAAAAASVLILASASLAQAMGPTPHTTPSKSATKAVGKLTPAVIDALQQAQKLAVAGDVPGAMAQIKIAQAVPNPNDHDVFYTNQLLSVLAANSRDYPTAMTAYDTMIANPDFALQGDDEKKTAYHDAMIVAQNVQAWPKILTYGQALEAMHANDDVTYTLMAIAYYQQNDKANATAFAQKAVDAAKTENKTPPQQANDILMNTTAQNNPAAMRAMMEENAVAHNDPDMWYRLCQITLGSGSFGNLDALYIYRLQFMAGGMEKGDDYLVMSSLADVLGLPTEGVKVFDQGVSGGKASPGGNPKLPKMRKDAATDERNLAAYAASAAKAKSGEQDAKMAEDYWGYGRYADAEASARQAIAKGYPKDPSEGLMVLGQAQVAQGKFDDAIATFGQVKGNANRMASAHLWSLYAQARKNAGH